MQVTAIPVQLVGLTKSGLRKKIAKGVGWVGKGRWGRGGGGEEEADTENVGGAATQAGGCFNYFIVWLS